MTIALHARFAWMAREFAGAVAISDNTGPCTFAELCSLIEAMARGLAAAGLTDGDRFLIVSANRREAFAAYAAASAAGCVCVHLNTRLASAELQEIATDACPVLAIVDREGAMKLTAGGGVNFPIIDLDAATDEQSFVSFLQAGSGFSLKERAYCSDAALFQLYTSGTTGKPSGIIISQGAWATQIEQFRITQPYVPGQSVLVVTPLFHIAAAITATAAIISGARIVLPPAFDAAEVLAMLNSGDVTGTMMVPAMIDMVLAEAEQEHITRINGVRRICYGASPISEPTLRRALGLFGCDFVQGYGLTEVAGVATILMPDDHRQALSGKPELLRSAGRPVMGEGVRIRLDSAGFATAHEVGEVEIRGDNLFSGYFANEAKTQSVMTHDGWFRTGDAGFIDDEGYLFVVDRIKDMVISGGENVYPQEVERVIAEHPCVAQVAVFGVPDGRWGEVLNAAIVPQPAADFDEEVVRAFIETRLARFKQPRRYHCIDALPRNATGKVLRRELAAMLAPDMDAAGSSQ